MDYDISERTDYTVRCEGCAMSTGAFETEESVSRRAQQLGFIAVRTPDDGTLNFCSECRESLEPA